MDPVEMELQKALWRVVVDLLWADNHKSDPAEWTAAVQSAIKFARQSDEILKAQIAEMHRSVA